MPLERCMLPLICYYYAADAHLSRLSLIMPLRLLMPPALRRPLMPAAAAFAAISMPLLMIDAIRRALPLLLSMLPLPFSLPCCQMIRFDAAPYLIISVFLFALSPPYLMIFYFFFS